MMQEPIKRTSGLVSKKHRSTMYFLAQAFSFKFQNLIQSFFNIIVQTFPVLMFDTFFFSQSNTSKVSPIRENLCSHTQSMLIFWILVPDILNNSLTKYTQQRCWKNMTEEINLSDWMRNLISVTIKLQKCIKK